MRRAHSMWNRSPLLSKSATHMLHATPLSGARSSTLLFSTTSRTAAPTLSATGTASTTFQGLHKFVHPLRLATKRFTGARVPRRSYTTQQPAEAAEVAGTAESLGALRTEFLAFQRGVLNWDIAGVPVPKAALWLALFQCMGVVPYSFYALGHRESAALVREQMARVQEMTADLSIPSEVLVLPPGPGFSVRLPSWENTALRTLTYLAGLSVIAFFWARRRTRQSFNAFVLSRAMGESTGSYPISMANVTRKGESFRIKGSGIKLVRKEVMNEAGIKAVQVACVLSFSSLATSYGLARWLDAKVSRDVIHGGRSRSDAAVVHGETVMSAVVLLNFLLSWAALVYQPFTIFPFIISKAFAPMLSVGSTRTFKDLTRPVEEPAQVTKHTTVVERDGGKEYITFEEKRTGNMVERTETRVFVSGQSSDPTRQILEGDNDDDEPLPSGSAVAAGNHVVEA